MAALDPVDVHHLPVVDHAEMHDLAALRTQSLRHGPGVWMEVGRLGENPIERQDPPADPVAAVLRPLQP